MFDVYTSMGAGFLEAVYQECLALEFGHRGIPFVQQKRLELAYRGTRLKQEYVADFVCYDKIIVEIKAVSSLLPEHRAQVLNYLHATGYNLGLLINFGHYPKAEVERIVRHQRKDKDRGPTKQCLSLHPQVRGIQERFYMLRVQANWNSCRRAEGGRCMGDYSLYRNYFINTSANYFWFEEIDFVKGFAIFSVILLHALPKNILFLTLAPFHIWHAVPIFMMIAGLNASISIFRRGSFKISREYSFARFKVYFTRLLVPFSLIWIIEVLILIASGEATSKKIFFSYLYGGMGPGSYFTPLFLQHLIFFPIVLWIKERLNLFLGDYYTIAFFFGLSVFAEYLCIFFNCPNWIYRMLYVRYLFFAVVGSYLFVNSFSKKFVYVFIVLGFIYIYIYLHI